MLRSFYQEIQNLVQWTITTGQRILCVVPHPQQRSDHCTQNLTSGHIMARPWMCMVHHRPTNCGWGPTPQVLHACNICKLMVWPSSTIFVRLIDNNQASPHAYIYIRAFVGDVPSVEGLSSYICYSFFIFFIYYISWHSIGLLCADVPWRYIHSILMS